ncbi:hypothetical protein LTR62_006335 [Meristemomyces frigidus]|uniref:DOMON domain-containing protein n=1 Tax=Meristemomyces frigidus TaxID=1508187 RepID=A0AAN7TCK4_9PEZI|nr:hypothetical protein LTR62_006335 [Meristemomyces frigidus]
MPTTSSLLLAWTSLALIGRSSAGTFNSTRILQSCPNSEICYEVNVPDSTAKSGTGDLYIRISAPTSYTWAAIGQGNQMAGANMFIAYTSADGKNVTVSQRSADGHNMPTEDSSSTMTLLDGTGVNNNTMVANIRCSSCAAWAAGTMNLTDAASDWIYAYKKGSQLNSDSASAQIQQHDDYATFKLNLTNAVGGSTQNPFMDSNAYMVGETAQPSRGGNPDPSLTKSQNTVLYVHAVLASVAFVALFPGGAILIRLGNFKGVVWVHAGMQALGYVIYTVGAALGIYLAVDQGNFVKNSVDVAHPVIGLILLGVLFTQPFSGLLHHKQYNAKGRRTIFSYLHMFTGRAGIALGMINGAIGFWLVHGNKQVGSKAAYIVIAALVFTVYVAAIVLGEKRRKSRKAGY